MRKLVLLIPLCLTLASCEITVVSTDDPNYKNGYLAGRLDKDSGATNPSDANAVDRECGRWRDLLVQKGRLDNSPNTKISFMDGCRDEFAGKEPPPGLEHYFDNATPYPYTTP